MEELLQRLAELRPIFEQEPRIAAVYLFGSQVDGYAMPWSDIDLAVLWTEPVSFATELDLGVQLSLVLGTDRIDLLNLGKAPLPLKQRVISTGLLLYERTPEPLSNFIEETMRRYFDFCPVLETYHREFVRSLEYDYAL